MTSAELVSSFDSGAQLVNPGRLLIGGEWLDSVSKERFETVNPCTELVLTSVARGGADDVDRAVDAARAAFADGSDWRLMTASERTRLINRLADLIERDAEEIARLEAVDVGKPAHIARAVDVTIAIDQFRYMAGWCTKIHGTTIPVNQAGDHHAYTRREPVGVVAAITPWNFPFMLYSWKLAPAFAAGCTVILKPAEQSPLTALKLGELVEEAGFPAGVLNIVTGYGDVGAALASHPGVDKVSFTGSTSVGKSIIHAAAGNLKRLTLELGGKSPNIIFADADLEHAIPDAAIACFFNSGQACSAGTRLFVERSIYHEVVDGIAAVAGAMKLGPSVDSESDLGPLISQEQYDKVLNYVATAKSGGATAVVGGEGDPGSGWFVQPTVLTGTTADMAIEREEVFGPVICVIPFDDVDEVVERANDSDYGLAAGIYTRDLTTAHTTAARLKAGTVWINGYGRVDGTVPFGGFKQSGWGREMGGAGLDAYLEDKSVWVSLS